MSIIQIGQCLSSLLLKLKLKINLRTFEGSFRVFFADTKVEYLSFWTKCYCFTFFTFICIRHFYVFVYIPHIHCYTALQPFRGEGKKVPHPPMDMVLNRKVNRQWPPSPALSGQETYFILFLYLSLLNIHPFTDPVIKVICWLKRKRYL